MVVDGAVERLPRKVVTGTVVLGRADPYPGEAELGAKFGALVDRMAEQAKTQTSRGHLDLVVFPENAASPVGKLAAESAVALDGQFFTTLAGVARAHQTYIVVGAVLVEKDRGETLYSNSAVLLDRDGGVSGVYRKVHPVAKVGRDDLEGGVTPGDAYPVFPCDFGLLGMQICWDIVYTDGWQALGDQGAEIVAWPSASPATILPAARAARHRYYVVSSAWRDNATVYEPTGLVAARVEGPPSSVMVHELDLSHVVLGWSGFLQNGTALTERFGDRVGYHYSSREDIGLFWSNDNTTSIDTFVAEIGGEDIDHQIHRNAALQRFARRSIRTPRPH